MKPVEKEPNSGKSLNALEMRKRIAGALFGSKKESRGPHDFRTLTFAQFRSKVLCWASYFSRFAFGLLVPFYLYARPNLGIVHKQMYCKNVL